MSVALYVILLGLIWTAITGSLTITNLLFGGALGLLALTVLRARMGGPVLFTKAWRITVLAVSFIRDLVMSAVRVAILVCRPNMKAHLNPGIIAFPLTVQTDTEITLLANLITLTPGTLSVDVSKDRKFLYVHAIAVTDKAALVKEIADGFEAKIIEVSK
jgi:multicomponent Na+:H+ antiporter subunit E